MVVVGGVGLLVVIAFVAGVVLGRESAPRPGDRLAVVPTETDALAILAARCGDERVHAVELRVPDGGPTLWRIESAKGSIDRSYLVGAVPPPFGFATITALQPVPPGALEAVVTVDDTVDAERFDPAALERGDGFRAPCEGDELGLVELAFVVGALGVAAAYATMIRRWLADR